MLRAYIDEEKLRNSEVEFGFVTVEYPRLEPKVLTKETVPDGEMVDYLMASCRLFSCHEGPCHRRQNLY